MKGYNYLGWVFLFVYFLYPVTIIGIIVLSVSYLRKFGFVKGVINLRWEFLIIISQVLLLLASSQLNTHLAINNKLVLVVKNETDQTISPVYVYGRHEKVKISALKSQQTEKLRYRGKNIDYKTKNDFENRIVVEYKDKDSWKRQTVVGMDRSILDSLTIKFVDKDSVIAEIW